MCADEQPKQRFEPPPWEREAFERFQKEMVEREEREAALRVAREAAAQAAEAAAIVAGVRQDGPSPVEGALEMAAPPVTKTPAAAPEGVSLGAPITPRPASAKARTSPAIPEAQIEAMLIELRTEEPPAMQSSQLLTNAVMVFFAVMGVYISMQALVWLAKGGAPSSAGFMLRAAASFLVFLVGAGFLGGAYMLFRKHHR
jgi:hypothetical protein